METFLTFVPWLAVLACPVLMFWMMRGMSGGGCHKRPAEAHAGDEEIRQLKARLAELEEKKSWSEGSR